MTSLQKRLDDSLFILWFHFGVNLIYHQFLAHCGSRATLDDSRGLPGLVAVLFHIDDDEFRTGVTVRALHHYD